MSHSPIYFADAHYNSCCDETFDLAYMVNVIHYLEMQKALDEIHRILVPSGLFYIQFNSSIVDERGNVDYSLEQEEIDEVTSKFGVVWQRDSTRIDLEPKKHTHNILTLILKKEPFKQ